MTEQTPWEITFFLTCVEDGVEFYPFPKGESTRLRLVKTWDEFYTATQQLALAAALEADVAEGTEIKADFMCSSSMDFPEESTTNQEVIDLCNKIRE